MIFRELPFPPPLTASPAAPHPDISRSSVTGRARFGFGVDPLWIALACILFRFHFFFSMFQGVALLQEYNTTKRKKWLDSESMQSVVPAINITGDHSVYW